MTNHHNKPDEASKETTKALGEGHDEPKLSAKAVRRTKIAWYIHNNWYGKHPDEQKQ